MADNFPPKHVLMTADTVGGVWTYSMELARALGARGVRVSLATMGAPPAEWQRTEARQVPGLELYSGDFPLEWQDDPWDGVDEAGDWLLELAGRLRPDTVHVNGFAHAALPFAAPIVCVAHSCVASWWRAVKREQLPDRYQEYKRRVRRGLALANLVIAPSHAMLACLEQEYGFGGLACAIPNGRDAALFRPADKQKYVLASGRLWDEAKNLTALAAVAPSLSWPVLVAGESRDPDGRRQTITDVEPLGRLSTAEIADRFAHAPVYALPARYEPFGLSALEAALSGCALVLGDIPSLREVWGDAALFVQPNDHQALADALERVIRSSALREDLGSRARLRARRFSPERMALAYLDAYGRAALATRTGTKAAA